MWARWAEIAVALWLAASPFALRATDAAGWVAVELAAAAAVVVLAALSHHPRWRRAHLATLAVAVGLVGLGWWGTRGPLQPPLHQSHLVSGLLLAMFAIVPSRATRPPEAWQRYYERRLREEKVASPPSPRSSSRPVPGSGSSAP